MPNTTEPKIWPNHRSHPISYTNFYRWVLWIDGEEEVLKTVRRVKYVLHPTFQKGEVETDDSAGHFRIDARGWGSFYIRVIFYYEGGFSEEVSYFLDVTQFYKRKGPPKLKKCLESVIDEKQLISLYEEGYRDFSGIKIVPTQDQCLTEKSLIGGNFMNADLSGLEMLGTNLAMCNFQNANLTQANVSGANLTSCRLSYARLDGIVICGVNKTDWIVDGVKATHVFMDSRRERRIPFGRDFGKKELARCLMDIPNFEDLVPPNSPRVFMSYSWQDEKAVLAVDQWLRNHGVAVAIDRRDFLAGDDLYEKMAETIKSVDKVVIFYSANSKDKPYTTLERRIAQEVEISSRAEDEMKSLLIYFQLDEERLPPEVSHRLSIRAKGRGFNEACQVLLDAIMERRSRATNMDLERYEENPPW